MVVIISVVATLLYKFVLYCRVEDGGVKDGKKVQNGKAQPSPSSNINKGVSFLKRFLFRFYFLCILFVVPLHAFFSNDSTFLYSPTAPLALLISRI